MEHSERSPTAQKSFDVSPSTPAFTPPAFAPTCAAMAVAALGYGIGFSLTTGSPGILAALPALCLLARQRASWQAFGVGLLTGIAMYAPPLAFFFKIFGPFALLLWIIAALPIACFTMLVRAAHHRLGSMWAMCLTPLLWTGIEYFRSEEWYLRFAWLLLGQAAALLPGVRFAAIGVYGLGFVYMALAAFAVGPIRLLRAIGVAGLIVAAVLMYVPGFPLPSTDSTLYVAGLQAEEWQPSAVAEALDKLAAAHPEAQLLVLSEAAFLSPVPEDVRDVVRKRHVYLIAGGQEYVTQHDYFNMAFVIGPDGSDLFSQVKSVPVQFMNDGIPAAERQVWESPWGKIGIAICYDAGYATVMDDFVRQGACGLIVPTMDAMYWGEYERRMLHSRVAPTRSAEYGIPMFGVWSSGVSQLVDRSGQIVATAGYPGQGETIAGKFDLSRAGHIPPDRPLALAAMVGTAIFIACLIVRGTRDLLRR